MAPRGRTTQLTKGQTKQSNQLSIPHQDDCKTRMDIKPGLEAPGAIWYQNRLFPTSVKQFDPDRVDI